jgi:integrase
VVELPPDKDGRVLTERIFGTTPRENNTKAAAEKAMRAAIERVRTYGVTGANGRVEKKEVPTFRNFVNERFLEYTEARNKPSEIKNKQSMLERHLMPVFGDMRLDQIRPVHIEDYKRDKLKEGRVHKERALKTGKEKAAGLSKKTIDNHLILLRRVLNVAREWELIDRTPKHELYRPKNPGFDFLDFEEAQRLIEAARAVPGSLPRDHFEVGDGDWGRMILLALRTGMRIGELLALRWPNASLRAARVHVCEAIVRGIRGTPKGNRTRDIPLSAQAMDALRQQRHSRVCGEQVFCDLEGKPLRWEQCKKPLAIACRLAELRPVGWHTLRHTFASHLVMRGVALKAVQELLGHQSIEMTMRYAHLAPAARLAAVAVLDEPAPSFDSRSPDAGTWHHRGTK